MAGGDNSPTGQKRRRQEMRWRQLAFFLVVVILLSTFALVPYLLELNDVTAGRESVLRWLGQKKEIKERYLSFKCDKVIPPFGVDTTNEIFELYQKSRTDPHWSTWPPPPTIPLEEDYEVPEDDEFEPYVDEQQEQFKSDQVEAQIMVLGYHNTGTSMLSKLLLLMGAYGGAKSKLMIGSNNKLKYFERDDVIAANQGLQGPYEKHLNMPHKFFQVKGYLVENATEKVLDTFNSQASKVMHKLNTHPVWFTKDPRLCLTLDFWMPHVKKPVCVVAYRHPVVLSQRLIVHGGKSMMAQGDLNRFAAQWERYMINSLRNCVGHPTIIVPTTLAAVPYHRILLGYLWRELKLAGVPGLHVPRREFLKQHYDQYFDPNNIKATFSNVASTCAALEGIEGQEGVGVVPECSLRDISEEGLNVQEQYNWCTRDGMVGGDKAVMHLTPPQKALVEVIEHYMEERIKGDEGTELRDVAAMLIERVTQQLLYLLN